MAPLPSSLIRALSLPADPSKSSISTSALGSGFTTTGKIRATVPRPDGQGEEERLYFVKTSSAGKAAAEMFRGEFESLNAIADIVPGFCPRALAWGPLDDDGGGGRTWFLATEYLELGGGGRSGSSLAKRLGKLHRTPAPPDPATGKRLFGFPAPTFCGDTKQPNRFRESWADFYAHERLLTVLAESERRNGADPALRELVETTAAAVVPALLADGHLGYDRDGHGDGIVPVVVHGDLWSGNASRGRIVGSGRREDEAKDEADGDVVYDPSACYAHSEYELGIMKMFGGFGGGFFDEYHRIVPRTEPVDEYEDRLRLYELYHHLNHYAIFGGGYRSGAVSIMQRLIRKYRTSVVSLPRTLSRPGVTFRRHLVSKIDRSWNSIQQNNSQQPNAMAPDRTDPPRTGVAEEQPASPAPPRPHPSFIQVAKPFVFEQTIQECIAAVGVDPLREESLRLQGVTWIDNVRRALHLYVF
ncbi:hypothetical protein VTN02DRAFT_3358 [Thermoascus thermophilus]